MSFIVEDYLSKMQMRENANKVAWTDVINYGYTGPYFEQDARTITLGQLAQSFKAEISGLRDANERLRALVGELAYALDASCDCHCRCDGCKMADESKFDCPDKAWRALVARARKAIGGAK